MATNFLEYSGGTNGFLTAPVTMMTTELNTLASGANVVQSVAGNFSQASFGSGIWGIGQLQGTTTITPTAGGYVAVWFLYSPDGGTTFETQAPASTDMPRPPDMTFPLLASALGTNWVVPSSGLVRIPNWSFKCFAINHSGVALASTGNIIKMASIAIQY